jgi:hypothetical protein
LETITILVININSGLLITRITAAILILSQYLEVFSEEVGFVCVGVEGGDGGYSGGGHECETGNAYKKFSFHNFVGSKELKYVWFLIAAYHFSGGKDRGDPGRIYATLTPHLLSSLRCGTPGFLQECAYLLAHKTIYFHHHNQT